MNPGAVPVAENIEAEVDVTDIPDLPLKCSVKRKKNHGSKRSHPENNPVDEEAKDLEVEEPWFRLLKMTSWVPLRG